MKKKIETYYNIDCLLTQSEVCRILNISKSTFYRIVKPKIKCIEIHETVIRYEPKIITEYIERIKK